MEIEADFTPDEMGVKVTATVCVGAPALIVKVVGLMVNCEAFLSP